MLNLLLHIDIIDYLIFRSGTIYKQYAQNYGLSKVAPHSEFHKLISRIQKLATRRNDLVHSFYGLLITDKGGVAALVRQPTKLKPSEGLREQEREHILQAQLETENSEIYTILGEIEKYRLQTIYSKYPDNAS